jgi:lipopolysaccharide transport system ATP-binding protein
LITAEHLSKRYDITERRGHGLLRDSAVGFITAPFRRFRDKRQAESREQYIWAMQDVSFEVAQGEVLGIIGRNGAGKSTLLKLLARITKPTSGMARIRGSVGSLLEVGTGFHPELTGRDNIYLNGAILGMKRSEIERKFSEIVEFSGVERFIDTPVKHYSSGMSVRLAFAVAAHLEPEILLIDEVLAVGDAEFQKRCLGRMEEVGAEGRTILFISHNMQAVTRICPRVIFLDSGRIVHDGPSHDVVRTYLDTGLGTSAAREWSSPADAPGDKVVRLKSIRVRSNGDVSDKVDIRHPVDIEVEYWYIDPDQRMRPAVGLHFVNEDGIKLFVSSEVARSEWKRPRVKGKTRVRCRIPGNLLAEGQVFVHLVISTPSPHVNHLALQDLVAFHVVDLQESGSVRGEVTGTWRGVVRPQLEWTAEDEDEQFHGP